LVRITTKAVDLAADRDLLVELIVPLALEAGDLSLEARLLDEARIEAVRGSRDSARHPSSVSAAGVGPISERLGLGGPRLSRAGSDGAKSGRTPAKGRSIFRTSPKLRHGSRCWTSRKTSPLASLFGSHHPAPPCVTMTISPAPRRYLRQRLELSLRSSSQGGVAFSSTVAQLTPARSSSTSR